MEDRRYSKKELQALKHLAELEKQTQDRKQNIIKWIAIIAASILFLVFFAAIIFSSKQTEEKVVTNVSSGRHTLGNNGAKVSLVEFSDFQCPACKASETYIKQALKEYPGKVKLIYKHFPLATIHKNSFLAAKVSEAASNQGKFWEMHSKLFENQEKWGQSDNSLDFFKTYAKELKIDEKTFLKDIESKEVEAKVTKDQDEGTKNGINSTPTFFVNNKRVDYKGNYESLKQAIDDELKAK